MIKRAGGDEEVVKSKIVSTLRTGDRMVIATAGGGGYGTATERDPADVQKDLRDGKSVWKRRVNSMATAAMSEPHDLHDAALRDRAVRAARGQESFDVLLTGRHGCRCRHRGIAVRPTLAWSGH